MSTTVKNETRLNVPLRCDLKQLVEQAAVELGQTVDEFAVSVLVQRAREVMQQQNRTELSNRDRDIFSSALDNLDAEPNDALRNAAERYKQQMS